MPWGTAAFSFTMSDEVPDVPVFHVAQFQDGLQEQSALGAVLRAAFDVIRTLCGGGEYLQGGNQVGDLREGMAIDRKAQAVFVALPDALQIRDGGVGTSPLFFGQTVSYQIEAVGGRIDIEIVTGDSDEQKAED